MEPPSLPNFDTNPIMPPRIPVHDIIDGIPLQRFRVNGQLLYRVQGLPIYSPTVEGCLKAHELFQSLATKGDLAGALHEYLKDFLKADKLSIFAVPGHELPEIALRGDPFTAAKISFYGMPVNSAIVLPYEQQLSKLKLYFSEEVVNFYMRTLTPSSSYDPFTSLPRNWENNFVKLFVDERARLASNPHAPGSKASHLHKYFYRNLFDVPLQNARPNDLLRAITTKALRIELSIDGGMIAKFSPDLSCKFLEIVDRFRLGGMGDIAFRPPYISEGAMPNIPVPQLRGRHFPYLSEGVKVTILEELPEISTSAPNVDKFLKAFGNAAKKTLMTGWNMSKGALKVIGHPSIAGPLHVLFAYKPEQKNAMEKALVNGTLQLGIGNVYFRTLANLGPVPVIVFGVGPIVADMMFDLKSVERNLPTNEEILGIGQDHPEFKEMWSDNESLEAYRGFFKACGAVQDLLKNFNYLRWYDRFIRKEVDQLVDDHIATYGKPLLPSFAPNLNTLQPVLQWPRVPFYSLDECELDWVDEGGVLKTRVPIRCEYWDQLLYPIPVPQETHDKAQNEPAEDSENRIASVPETQYYPHVVPKEKPTFRELLEIKNVELGEGIGGGGGMIVTLASDAKFSISTRFGQAGNPLIKGLDANANALITGVSAPMTEDFLRKLASGLVFHIPIAATLLAIHEVMGLFKKDVEEHLKEDQSKTKKEMRKVNASVEDFDRFSELFARGEIDKNDFTQRVNRISEQLHKAEDHLAKRGSYASKQDSENFEYFFQRTNLKQIDLDLKRATEEKYAQREVADHYVPEIKKLPFQNLVDKLASLSAKRLLTIPEKWQQEALKGEILARAQTEGIAALNQIDTLTNLPAGIQISPPPIVKPASLKAKFSYRTTKSSSKRQSHRVNSWLRKVDAAYNAHIDACKRGDYPQMVRTRNVVQELLEHKKMDFTKYWIKIKDPKNKDQTIWDVQDYVKDYIEKVTTAITDSMAKAKLVLEGKVSDAHPNLFTGDEIQAWKVRTAHEAFNRARENFLDEKKSREEKDASFRELYNATVALEAFQPLDEKQKLIVQVGKEYSCFSAYEKAQNSMDNLRSTIAMLKDPKTPEKDRKGLYEKADREAGKLLDCELKDEERKLALDVRQGYQDFRRLGIYREEVLPLFSSPMAKFGLMVLNDSFRYDNRPVQQKIAKGASLVHSIMPDFTPAAINYFIGRLLMENAARINGLGASCLAAMRSNVLSKIAADFRDPAAILKRSFTKQVATFKTYSTAMQLISGANSRLAMLFAGTSTAFHYGNIARKSFYAIQAGELFTKANTSKLGEGWVSLLMTTFVLFEFLRKSPAEFGPSKSWVAFVQRMLPTHRGDLPESPAYYMAKDMISLTAFGLLSLTRSRMMMGLASLGGMSTAYHFATEKYTDDALASIMMNLRYFYEQPKSEENDRAIKASLTNLNKFVTEFVLKEDDSIVRKQAKNYAFEKHIAHLASGKQWRQIVMETEFSHETRRFFGTHMELADQVNTLINRYHAVLQMMLDPDFVAEQYVAYVHEIAFVAQHMKEKKKPKLVLDTFEELRLIYVTNFSIFFVKGDINPTVYEGLDQFDSIPAEKRNVQLWYMLGTIAQNLYREHPHAALQELQLFAFETILTIIEDKEAKGLGITPFEAEVNRCAAAITLALRGTVGGQRDYDANTEGFGAIVQQILVQGVEAISL